MRVGGSSHGWVKPAVQLCGRARMLHSGTPGKQASCSTQAGSNSLHPSQPASSGCYQPSLPVEANYALLSGNAHKRVYRAAVECRVTLQQEGSRVGQHACWRLEMPASAKAPAAINGALNLPPRRTMSMQASQPHRRPSEHAHQQLTDAPMRMPMFCVCSRVLITHSGLVISMVAAPAQQVQGVGGRAWVRLSEAGVQLAAVGGRFSRT